MRFITLADLKLKKREKASHKGQNGRVLVVAGSLEYVGAAYLAGMAAFRSGVDAVLLAAPERVGWAVNCLSPDFITKKFKGNFFTAAAISQIAEMSRSFDVTLIGNGMGRNAQTLKFASAVCKSASGFKVIDADALASVRIQDVGNALFTPHHAEYELLLRNSMTFFLKTQIGSSRLGPVDNESTWGSIKNANLSNSNSPGAIANVQKILGSNVVLAKGYGNSKKRHVDAIIAKDRVAYSSTGNAGMTVGGTGDVLAGLAAGILAQEKDLFRAACAAAYVNGKAGDLLMKKYGWGFTASDLVDKLPAALKPLWG